MKSIDDNLKLHIETTERIGCPGWGAPNREYARLSLLHPSGSRHARPPFLLVAPLLAVLATPAARAQSNLLMPPSLPSALPGGQTLPGALANGLSGGLAGGAQGDLVQRLLDAASGLSLIHI